MVAPHLLRLEVLVEEKEGRLIGLGRSHDGEHALAGLIVRSLRGMLVTTLNGTASLTCLSDGDSGSGGLPDLADLAAGAADDAANHVCRDADILSLNLLAILIVSRRAAGGSI